LAKDAAQIAPPEEDRARPVPAAQAIFLTEMRKRACHSRVPSALAHPDFIVEPINLTIARTDTTRPERFHRFLGPLLKKSFLKRLHVSRNEIVAR
jgi:hypothetical protein